MRITPSSLPRFPPTNSQAVRNTMNRLIELYHPAPFHCQGYTFPQNPGQPTRGHICGRELFFLSAGQLQQEMLQGLAEESCGEVITCIEASTGILLVGEDLVGEIRSAFSAEGYFAVLGHVCKLQSHPEVP